MSGGMDDVSKSFMLKAQACMAANDFDDALNHLDHVVRRTKSGHRPPIDALDRRAVAFINLRRFAEAFQDSKRMIKEYRTDPRGYLRTVQVLKYQAQEKKDDTYVESALKVAMSGMKNANKSNIVLHKQLARVLERLKNPAEVVRHDPAKKLPNEIFIEILKNLKTSELLASRRVAKSWNGIVTGETRFWRKLDLRNVRTKFNTRGIQTLLHLATDANRQCQVTELNIAWTTRPKDADTVVRNILKKCTRLNTLRLPWWYSSTEKNPGWTGIKLPELENLTLEGLTVRGSLEWIGTTLSAFPTITRLTILDLPKDRRPQAYDPDQDDSFAGVSWPDSLPSLKHLDLFGLLHGPPTPFSAGWLHFDRLALSAPNLEHLNLNGTINFGAHETEMALLAPFENLTQVTIGGIAHGKFALSTASPLQVLSLEMMCDSSEFLDLRHDEKTARFSRLKKLAITDQLNTPDQWASFLDYSGCKLEELTIFGTSAAGRAPDHSALEWLQKFQESLGDLTKIGFHFCSSFDIDDRLAKWIASSLPSLTEVTFLEETSLTGVGIQSLVTSLPKLVDVYIGNSPSVNVDAIRFCRGHGVELHGCIGSHQIVVGKFESRKRHLRR